MRTVKEEGNIRFFYSSKMLRNGVFNARIKIKRRMR